MFICPWVTVLFSWAFKKIRSVNVSQPWWLSLIILTLGSLRQGDYKFIARLGDIEGHHLKAQADKYISCSKNFESHPAYLEHFVDPSCYFRSQHLLVVSTEELREPLCVQGAERGLFNASCLLPAGALDPVIVESCLALCPRAGSLWTRKEEKKGGLVADLGNRKILQSTDGHSAWFGEPSAAPRKPAGGLGQLREADGKGELRTDAETAVV